MAMAAMNPSPAIRPMRRCVLYEILTERYAGMKRQFQHDRVTSGSIGSSISSSDGICCKLEGDIETTRPDDEVIAEEGGQNIGARGKPDAQKDGLRRADRL